MAVVSFSAFGDGAFRRISPSRHQLNSQPHATYEINHLSFGSGNLPIGRVATASMGLPASICVKTDRGWTAVENIEAGTYVETFDDGWQPVQTIIRRKIEAVFSGESYRTRLVRIGSNIVGNTADLYVPAAQPVLLESDVAEDVFGDPFPIVTAQSLVEADMAEDVLISGNVELFELHFARSQLVFCSGGAVLLTHSQRDQTDDFAALGKSPDRYHVFDEMTAVALLRTDVRSSNINAHG
jgi:hypothetical protein